VTSITIEFDDISDELSRSDKLINDPWSWIVLVSSCSLFIICKKKHQVATIDELLEIQEQLENSVLNSEI
jgi:DNA repair protein RecN (Recombination protein N)